jgi:polysaccharide biosynthesis protein PslH
MKKKLLFYSAQNLVPADAGGKIRTSQVLKGMKGGRYEITLVAPIFSPITEEQDNIYKSLCDDLHVWKAAEPLPKWRRALDLLHPHPVNVTTDCRPQAVTAYNEALAKCQPDVIVHDFVHSAKLLDIGARSNAKTVCFTHNVEHEIFGRHAAVAKHWLYKQIWRSQTAKMTRFERDYLKRYNAVVAVSERDKKIFENKLGLSNCHEIPTGVDLDFFSYSNSGVNHGSDQKLVFVGALDWMANIDGITHFLSEVWPLIKRKVPNALFEIVGRNPTKEILKLVEASSGVSCKGHVPDVRPFVRSSQVFVIPLRVGGGTRLKAFEAMSQGCPIVSTTVGMEGLDAKAGIDFMLEDDPQPFANAVIELLLNIDHRKAISTSAYQLVQKRFGYQAAAQAFERVLDRALSM